MNQKPFEQFSQLAPDVLMEEMKKLSPEEMMTLVADMARAQQKMREELATEREKVAHLEKENGELKNEVWRLRVDPRTGLERDLLYYEGLNERITNLIQRGHLTEISGKESLDEEDIFELDKIHLSVTQADIGYLSKYNEDIEISKYYGEHGGGDEILKHSGAVIQKVDHEKRTIVPQLRSDVRGYRVGGDEFALVQDVSKDEAQRVALEFSRKHAQIEIKGADLAPSVNCGTASLREAVEAMMQAFPLSKRQAMAPDDQAKHLQNFLTKIADRRARLAKGLDRLMSMVELRREDPAKFLRNYKWMQKGAFGLEHKQFDELVPLLESPVELQEAIKTIVRQQLEAKQQAEEEQMIRERKIIVAIADRDL